MGYFDRKEYETRDASRLSREASGAPTITLERDRSGSFSKIADVSTSKGQLTPFNFGTNAPNKWANFARSAVRLAMKGHPLLRTLDFAISAAQLIQEYWQPWRPQIVTTGGFTMTCSTPIMSKCVTPGTCDQFAYCDGPTFGSGALAPLSCGLANQAFSYADSYGSAYAAAHAQANTNGFHVVMVRSQGNLPQPCINRGHIVQNYTRNNVFQPGKVRDMPNVVRYRPIDPIPFIKRWRWIDPHTPPFDPTPDPLPPPYEIIPDRPQDPFYESGNDTVTETSTERRPPDAWRFRPARRTTEKKYKTTATARALEYLLVEMGKGYGKLADFRDILKALDEALPSDLQAKGKCKKQIPCLLRNVLDHLESLHGEKALLNIIKELAEDVVGGFGDQLASESAAKNNTFKQKFHLSPRF